MLRLCWTWLLLGPASCCQLSRWLVQHQKELQLSSSQSSGQLGQTRQPAAQHAHSPVRWTHAQMHLRSPHWQCRHRMHTASLQPACRLTAGMQPMERLCHPPQLQARLPAASMAVMDARKPWSQQLLMMLSQSAQMLPVIPQTASKQAQRMMRPKAALHWRLRLHCQSPSTRQPLAVLTGTH